MPRRTLIVGCGYIGRPLAQALRASGDDVTGWVRSVESVLELRPLGLKRTIVGRVADPSCWRNAGAQDVVIHCASSGGGGAQAYREVFLEGVRQMNLRQPQARRIFVSSTSVFGQTDGSWVDELSATTPLADTSRILVEAEREAVAAGMIVVRSTGIYGPGRAVLFEKLRRGEAVMDGDGSRWINQIHQADLMRALIHFLDAGAPGEIYNAADDDPVMLRDYYAWCCGKLGLPMPPPRGEADPHRKRGLTNKRVSNRKLRTSGWVPQFPSFREGLAGQIG